jgi:hypothetical protein
MVSLMKELRSLRLPWGLAVVTGSVAALGLRFEGNSLELHIVQAVAGFAAFGFTLSLVLLAAMSFGVEFQQRTLPLLLSQPRKRMRLWNEKMLSLGLTVVTAVLAAGVALAVSYWVGARSGATRGPSLADLANQGTLVAGTFLLATVCSTSFWTMAARSTIGGLVFSVTSQFGAAGIAVATLNVIYGEDLPFEGVVTRVIVIGGLGYSALFLWLGRRKFLRLELRDAMFGEGVELSGAAAGGRWWSGWLVCRPRGHVLNLMRKELRLQKPVLLITAIFVACWFAVLAYHQLWPEREYQPFLTVLLGFQIPLSLILAGCISLGEEKTLGLAGWQLTWPVSVWKSWLVKLGVAIVVGLALGFVLPGIFALVNAPTLQEGGGPDAQTVATMLLLAWLTILVSFWSSTLMTNAVRSALMTIVALAVAGGCIALGIWGAIAPGGLQTGLLTSIMVHYQLSPGVLADRALGYWVWIIGFFIGGLAVLVLLGQSLAQFRRAEHKRTTLAIYSCVLGIILVAGAFWEADFVASAYGLAQSPPILELEQSIRSVVARKSPSPTTGKPQVVTLAELEQTGALSESTKTWLKGSVISYGPPVREYVADEARKQYMQYMHRYGLLYTCPVFVCFPDGSQFCFNF